MNFRQRNRDEPEINLIPFIDVLLVVLIFLMLSTTYSKFTEMQLRLPVADTEAQRDYPHEIIVAIGANGSFSVNRVALQSRSLNGLVQALSDAAKSDKEAVVVVSADASAKHQWVVTVMEAARNAGLNRITFAAQSSGQALQN
jgi:biopolymer transport protein ExbD